MRHRGECVNQWFLPVLHGAMCGYLKIETKQNRLRHLPCFLPLPRLCPVLGRTYFKTDTKCFCSRSQNKPDTINIPPKHSFHGGVSFTTTHTATQTRLSWVHGTFLAALTLAGVPSGFVTWETLALTHRNHPFSLSWAVDAWGGLTDGILHAGSLHLPQSIRHCLREGRQALHCGRARLVINPGWE